MTITVQDVKERIAEIERSGDPEDQHGIEDALYLDVLQAIADGAENPTELAREAIAADTLDFPRWYA